MAMIPKEHVDALRHELGKIPQAAKLIFFTQESECPYCKHTGELLKELAGLSSKIALEVYDFQKDKAKAEQYDIDKIPAVVVEGAVRA